MTIHNLEFPRGDTYPFRVPITDDADPPQPIDLTSAALAYALMRAPGSTPFVNKSIGSGITVVGPPTDGIVDIVIDPADTEALPAGTYYHEAELTEVSGRVTTVLEGKVVVTATSIP